MRRTRRERHVEDARTRPKNLWNASEHVRKALERRGEENIPRRAPDKPYNLGGETAVPGGVHDVQECPRSISNECANETDALHRDRPPGRALDLPDRSRGVERNWVRRKVVEGAEYDGIGPEDDGKRRNVETNALRRDRGPEDLGGEQEVMGRRQGRLGPPKRWRWRWI